MINGSNENVEGSEEIPSNEIEPIARLRTLRDNWFDGIPSVIIEGTGRGAERHFKVRHNWFANVHAWLSVMKLTNQFTSPEQEESALIAMNQWTSPDFISRKTKGVDIESTNRLICQIIGDEYQYLVKRASLALEAMRERFPNIVGRDPILDPVANKLVGHALLIQSAPKEIAEKAKEDLWSTLSSNVVQETLGWQALDRIK
jgi:hypothetical protein